MFLLWKSMWREIRTRMQEDVGLTHSILFLATIRVKWSNTIETTRIWFNKKKNFTKLKAKTLSFWLLPRHTTPASPSPSFACLLRLHWVGSLAVYATPAFFRDSVGIYIPFFSIFPISQGLWVPVSLRLKAYRNFHIPELPLRLWQHDCILFVKP